MKKTAWLVIICLLLPGVAGIRAGVFVEFPDGLESQCVEIKDGATAKQALQASRFSSSFSYGGLFLDSINGVANDFAASKSWWFYYSRNNRLQLSDVGVADYKLRGEGQFVYFGYYGYDASFSPTSTPKSVGFYDACPEAANRLVLDGVYIYQNGSYLPVNSTLFFAKKGQKFRVLVRLLNEQLADEVSEPRDYRVTADVGIVMGDFVENERVYVSLDSTAEAEFELEFPYSEPGYYSAAITVAAFDSYERYGLRQAVLFSVPSEREQQAEVPPSTEKPVGIVNNTSTPPVLTGAAVQEMTAQPTRQPFLLPLIITLLILAVALTAVLVYLLVK